MRNTFNVNECPALDKIKENVDAGLTETGIKETMSLSQIDLLKLGSYAFGAPQQLLISTVEGI